MKKLLLSFLALGAGLMANAQDLYIIGANVDGASWALGTNPMTNNGDGSYTWKGDVLASGFKFNDGSWNGEYNIGNYAGAKVDVDSPGPWYVDVENNGSSQNIEFTNPAVTLTDVTVTLFSIDDAPYIEVIGNAGDAEYHYTLAGNFNGWTGNDSAYELMENNGLYVGTFNIPAESEFEGNTEGAQFKVVLNGSTWYGVDGENSSVSFLDSTTVSLELNGDSNIYFVDFEGGNVTFTLDADAMVLTLTYGDSGVEKLGADFDGKEVIYNLQGVRVNNVSKGLYIINGKKVLVK